MRFFQCSTQPLYFAPASHIFFLTDYTRLAFPNAKRRICAALLHYKLCSLPAQTNLAKRKCFVQTDIGTATFRLVLLVDHVLQYGGYITGIDLAVAIEVRCLQ